METLLLTFANQQPNLLPTLQEEDDELSRILTPHVRAGHFHVQRESFVTLEKLYENLILFREELVLFLFSGHAGRDLLEMGDGTAYGSGLAQMLDECRKLKLVFLNGCSTAGQVKQLLACGVPVVIATSAAVEDPKATFFSIQFFKALEQQCSIREAFNLAQGMLEAKFKDSLPEIRVYKSIGPQPAEAPVWGLYCTEQHEHILDWKLSNAPSASQESSQFTPNELLINTLFQSFAQYSDDVRDVAGKEQSGMPISITRKRMIVWNALPPLLAEPVRKLLATVNEENKGYDKISAARVERIVRAYETGMDLLGFILLAQIWDAFNSGTVLQMEPAQRARLTDFMHVAGTERQALDLIPLLQDCLDILERNNIPFFIPELNQTRQLTREDRLSVQALNSLHYMRLQVNSGNLNPSMMEYWCRLGEENLTRFYSQLCFLAQYKLATVQDIDVLKFKHKQKISFGHDLIRLEDLLGEYELWQVEIEQALDNYSTLLWQKDWNYLNLSPFVIDENAFQKHDNGQKKNEICKMYFYSHYLEKADIYCFKFLKNPEYPYLEVSASNYRLVWEQLKAFSALLNP